MKIYALYQGEQNIMDGTLDEIAEHQGIKKETVKFLMSPAHKRRIKDDGNNKVVVRLDE